MTAYLQSHFADREAPTKESISDLVQEIKKVGYASLKEVKADVDRVSKVYNRYEAKYPPLGLKFFNPVGVVRGSLALASKRYLDNLKRHAGDGLNEFAKEVPNRDGPLSIVKD